jgi:hypothetical protein
MQGWWSRLEQAAHGSEIADRVDMPDDGTRRIPSRRKARCEHYGGGAIADK